MVLDDLGNPSGVETDRDIPWGFSLKEILHTPMNVLWKTHMLPVSVLRDVSRAPVQVST